MPEFLTVKRFAACLAGITAAFQYLTVEAQLVSAPLTDGFARSSSIQMSVDEMLGSRKPRTGPECIFGPGYPELWIAEIQYKPVRLMQLPVKDPKTGETTTELIWYMVYRFIPRDYTDIAGAGKAELVQKLTDPQRDPENPAEKRRSEPLSIPRFLLKIDDVSSGEEDPGYPREYVDQLNRDVQQAVFQREIGRRGQNVKLHNSVEAIQEVGDPVAADDPDALSHALYGVAISRNVDPRTDYFTVYMSGLTNAYRIRTEKNGQQVIEEKVVVQKFARPGDEFKLTEQEFQFLDDTTAEIPDLCRVQDPDKDQEISGDSEKPEFRLVPKWVYRPRNMALQVPDFEGVLRNAGQQEAKKYEN